MHKVYVETRAEEGAECRGHQGTCIRETASQLDQSHEPGARGPDRHPGEVAPPCWNKTGVRPLTAQNSVPRASREEIMIIVKTISFEEAGND